MTVKKASYYLRGRFVLCERGDVQEILLSVAPFERKNVMRELVAIERLKEKNWSVLGRNNHDQGSNSTCYLLCRHRRPGSNCILVAVTTSNSWSFSLESILCK